MRKTRAAQQRAEVRSGGCSWHPRQTQLYFLSVIVPADGTSAASRGNGDFGTSPIFGQLSDKLLLACTDYVGVPDPKHNGSEELSVQQPCFFA
jgi:hypothetical protein